MKASSISPGFLVIDTGVAVWAVLPMIAAEDTLPTIRHWRTRGFRIAAPSLLFAEGTSVIRRLIHSGLLTEEEGLTALADIFELSIEIIPLSSEHCRAALRWADRLGHAKAYDGFYLAVAEERHAELWTTDEHLVRKAKQLDITWIRGIGEAQ